MKEGLQPELGVAQPEPPPIAIKTLRPDSSEPHRKITSPTSGEPGGGMEVHHRPKPLHSWREFLSEIGVVVIGVLIALAAEQTVEALHWAGSVREARLALKEEFVTDTGPQAYQRLAESPCVTAQLDSLEQTLLAERDHGVGFHVKPIIVPYFFTWDRDGWQNAVSSGAAAHMSPQEMNVLAAPYDSISALNETALREAHEYAELAFLASSTPTHPSEDARDRLLRKIASARGDDLIQVGLIDKLLTFANHIGLNLSAAQKRDALRDRTFAFAACRVVREPEALPPSWTDGHA